MLLSIVVPVFREEKNIPEFLRRIRPILAVITEDYEIIFSMDPSPDRTEDVVLAERATDPRIKLLKFSRRFGQPMATLAGMEYSRGEAVSSSRVRAALLGGQVKTAADLLGRPYRLAGVVVSGAKRGRTIGFPTANLDRIETLIPGEGVYAVRAIVNGQSWPAAANIGPNPTFGENARKVEIHLIGFHGDIYDKTLSVEFEVRLRETRPFEGVAALIEQLHADVAQAKQILSEDAT